MMKPSKKVHSSGSIAFSWEDKPGVRKALPSDIGSAEAFPQKSCSTTSPPPPTTENHLDESSNRTSAIQDMKIPPPPCRSQPPPRRSTFWKGFRRQQDPFLVAYKECSKTPTFDHKTGVGFNSKASKTRVSFSCKSSVDARDDHFVKPSMPPRLPHASNPSFTTNT